MRKFSLQLRINYRIFLGIITVGKALHTQIKYAKILENKDIMLP
jgi:hypothetical protein